MRSFWSEPFLWIHLAGLAVLPLCLETLWLGLAVGTPVLPFPIELLLVAGLGITPILWMQWHRPFDIFSVLIFAVQPEELNDEQRKILSLFKTKRHRIFAVLTAVVMLILLWQIYRLAPMAATAALSLPQSHLLGLLIAALGFAASNLFLQIPVSVLAVMLTKESEFASVIPYETEQIRREFTIPGIQVRQILSLN